MKRQLTIVNRHYPPNINITGENAWDLANYLINTHGIDVSIVHINRSYEGGGGKRLPVGNCYPVQTIYEGSNKLLGYLSGFWDGIRLIQKARALNDSPIIVMTSPPLLPLWASLFLGKQKREWILWSMDLFPEGFAASNQIKPTNLIYKWAKSLTYKYAPSKIIALGPEQKTVLETNYNKQIDGITLPCGVFIDQNKVETLPTWKAYPEKIYFGYAGNCGTPHNPNFIKAAIDAINPTTQHMMLALYGVYAAELKNYATGKEGITLIASIPRNELHFIDVHLVSLTASWTHIAVPSKAVSSVCSGATILFCGDKNSDNWQLLGNAGWFIEENEHLHKTTQATMNNITKDDIVTKQQQAKAIAQQLSENIIKSYDTIATWAK
jgi:hypothetical protein